VSPSLAGEVAAGMELADQAAGLRVDLPGSGGQIALLIDADHGAIGPLAHTNIDDRVEFHIL